MKERKQFRIICCFYKILNNQVPAYLYSLLPTKQALQDTYYSKIRQIFCRTKTFINSFLPQKVRKWNKLNASICQGPSYSVFRKAILDFIRQTANSTFGTNDVSGLKILIRLRVAFRPLREHKFNLLYNCLPSSSFLHHFFRNNLE